MISSDVWVLISAGSAGSRLWPERDERGFLTSHSHQPSQLQQTIAWLAAIALSDQIMISCSPSHITAIVRQCSSILESNFIVEPLPKGSGPVIALVAGIVAYQEPDAIVVSVPVNHRMDDQTRFHAGISAGIRAARDNQIAVVGQLLQQRTNAAPQHGYIERSDERVAVSGDTTAYHVMRFWTDAEFLEADGAPDSSKLLANTSGFSYRVASLRKELERLRPELATLMRGVGEEWRTYDYERVSAYLWSTTTESSMERNVLEHVRQLVVVPNDPLDHSRPAELGG